MPAKLTRALRAVWSWTFASHENSRKRDSLHPETAKRPLQRMAALRRLALSFDMDALDIGGARLL